MERSQKTRLFSISLPEFLNFVLVRKDQFSGNKQVHAFWPNHSGSEVYSRCVGQVNRHPKEMV